jgi:hypothetical protein
VVAPATAVGREATVDRGAGGPTAHDAALPLPALVVPAAGLVVRAAAGPASRWGANIVAGIVGTKAPQIGKIRTVRALKDAHGHPSQAA